MSELKPCPFCGEMPKVNTWTMHGITESRCFCDNEKCPVYLSKTIAIDDWNTRPIEDALNARIAELELRLDVYNGNMYDVVVDSLFKANKRIAELEAERRWIPVSERLPEGSGHYIVFDDHGDIMSCEFLADYKGEPLWDDDDGVLYWMPLPQPPEVQG